MNVTVTIKLDKAAVGAIEALATALAMNGGAALAEAPTAPTPPAAPAAPAAPPADDAVNAKDVRAVLKAFVGAKGRDGAVAVLSKYGNATNVSTLDKSHYQAAIAEMLGVLGMTLDQVRAAASE